ncbi:hypothetical protein WICPIJ_008572 [Wickerhamomyces pijperi]|uniref:Uncharacterized protein n=1 Tax=Wickerhamomyces pijperi TaxID=599730 RepID=A0A9P8TI51_WICPI|nr:hypothetical protein WICPIJ_008572 [Wickerhamomyces pijperi]
MIDVSCLADLPFWESTVSSGFGSSDLALLEVFLIGERSLLVSDSVPSAAGKVPEMDLVTLDGDKSDFLEADLFFGDKDLCLSNSIDLVFPEVFLVFLDLGF